MTHVEFLDTLRWIDGQPLSGVIEPYRRALFTRFLDQRDAEGFPLFNLGLFGRSKKNWKSADLIFAALAALCEDTPGLKQCFLVAFDEDQAHTDLDLLKLLVRANPALHKHLVMKQNEVVRRDGRGGIKVLPGQSELGEHGRTYRFLGIDEIHTQRHWDLLEALQPDPTRRDAQTWITSYASLFHRPGVPLYDLMQMGRTGADPKMLFSWYAADYTTDAAFQGADPETRANPSRASWADQQYLPQQQRRLPAHKYRRLHLNLPGLPEGSAFQVEPVINAIARGIKVRLPEPGIVYSAFVDMSGGSNDDAALAIAHADADGRAVIDRVENQGQPAPFNPRFAIERFVRLLREYGISTVTGDNYAGDTFKADFKDTHGITYLVSTKTASQLYEALEPELNAHRVVLLDVPEVEQQLLGLVWKGSKIDHPSGEHDDHANAVAGVAHLLLGRLRRECCDATCAVEGCSGFHFHGANAAPRTRDQQQAADDQEAQESAARSAEQIEDTCATAPAHCWFPGDGGMASDQRAREIFYRTQSRGSE